MQNLILLTSILLVIFIILIFLYKNKNNYNSKCRVTELFSANVNIPQPSLNFNYLKDSNYSERIKNRYYIDDDISWKVGRYRYGLIPHEQRYHHTLNGYDYYYGSNWLPVAVDDILKKIDWSLW